MKLTVCLLFVVAVTCVSGSRLKTCDDFNQDWERVQAGDFKAIVELGCKTNGATKKLADAIIDKQKSKIGADDLVEKLAAAANGNACPNETLLEFVKTIVRDDRLEKQDKVDLLWIVREFVTGFYPSDEQQNEPLKGQLNGVTWAIAMASECIIPTTNVHGKPMPLPIEYVD
jgi:hypothetical protein